MLTNDTYHRQAIENRERLIEASDAASGGGQESPDIAESKEADDAHHQARRNVAGLADVLQTSGNPYAVDGYDHMTFTDIGLFGRRRRGRRYSPLRPSSGSRRVMSGKRSRSLSQL